MAGELQGGIDLAGGGLNLVGAIDPNATDEQKAFAAAAAAAAAAKGTGAITGSTGLSSIGGGLSTGLGLAGAGYGVYSDATNPNLSTGQRAGHAAGDVANTIASLVVPYYGIGVAAKGIADVLRASGSPTLRATGNAIAAPALPVEGLLNVLSGDKSPKAAANTMVEGFRSDPVLGPVWNSVADAFGLGTKPTTGTMFRREFGSILPQVGVKGANTTLYNAPSAGYGSFDPKAVAAAQSLASTLTPYARDAKRNMPAYSLQAQNILLNNYGNNLPALAAKIMAHFNR